MPYTSRLPRPPLDAYIDDFYYLDSPPPAPRLKVFPMPSLHLMINLGSAFEVSRADQASRVDILAESWCTGMWDTYHVVRYPASNVRLYGVHFKPGALRRFCTCPCRTFATRSRRLRRCGDAAPAKSASVCRPRRRFWPAYRCWRSSCSSVCAKRALS